MLMKLSPGINFINILHSPFSYESAFLPKSFYQSQNVTREKMLQALSYKKPERKMLKKDTSTGNFLFLLCNNNNRFSRLKISMAKLEGNFHGFYLANFVEKSF